jgi:hypothetical protein
MLVLLCSQLPALAQAPPATDVYLFAIDGAGGEPSLGLPVNITARDGYDNQPAFTADGKRLLYTSIRGDQADIYAYTLATSDTERVTDTPESEYSPTVIDGGAAISVIRQDLEGKQYLYRYPLSKEGVPPAEGQSSLLLPEVEPVGYHGWSGDRLLLFVLGEPATLRVATRGEAGSKVLADNPGRSFHPVPGSAEVACVLKGDSENDWTIEAVDLATGERRPLGATRPGREDFAFGPGGEIWMGDGSKLYRRAAKPGAEWTLVRDFEPLGLGTISRLAFDAQQRWLALVADRAAVADAEPQE